MKKISLIAAAFLLLVAAALFRGVSPTTEPATSTLTPAAIPTLRASNAAMQAAVEVKVRQAPAKNPLLLSKADNCLRFIAAIAETTPEKRQTVKAQLFGLAAALYINDYVLAAPDIALPKTSAGISNALLNAVGGLSEVTAAALEQAMSSNLQQYSRLEESLPQHYQRIGENRKLAPAIESIGQVIQKSGSSVNPQSDLLLDCLRFAALQTEFDEFYGVDASNRLESLKRDLAKDYTRRDGQILPPLNQAYIEEIGKTVMANVQAERSASADLLNQILHWRLTERYGMPAEASGSIARLVLATTAYGASPADLHVPGYQP